MPNTDFNFEKALKELEEITTWFESGDADLDHGLVKFERGMELAGQLKVHLADIENRVEKIKHKFAPAAEPAATAAPNEADSDEPPVSDNQAGLF